MNPATQPPRPGDRDRALRLRRRLNDSVGIGGVTAVGAFVYLASAAATAGSDVSASASTPPPAAAATTPGRSFVRGVEAG